MTLWYLGSLAVDFFALAVLWVFLSLVGLRPEPGLDEMLGHPVYIPLLIVFIVKKENGEYSSVYRLRYFQHAHFIPIIV